MAVESLHDPPVAQPLAQPYTLAYDDLPPGSDLRRQYGEGGSVTITAPAGEPSDAARRDAMHSTGVFAALLSGACFIILFIAFEGPLVVETALRLVAAAIFGVLCVGVFLLTWRVTYSTRLGILTESRRQVTLLHASPSSLLVEATGPHGDQSLDVRAAAIRSVQVVPEGLLNWSATRDPVPCLTVITATGAHRLLPGRQRSELEWVARTLRQALGNPPVRAVQ